jgi:hypothetical protein
MGFADRRPYRNRALEVRRVSRALPITVLPALPSLHDRLSNRWFEAPSVRRIEFPQPV